MSPQQSLSVLGELQQNKQAPQWQGELSLRCEGRPDQGTRLVNVQHSGPLYVQKPFYPEGRETMHVYPLHPPGGVVSGDELCIHLQAIKQAKVVVTTPGATRFYKSRFLDKEKPQQSETADQFVSNHISIQQQSSVEWLPMETITFNGASASALSRIDMDADSSFLGWEVACLGLPASDELFKQGRFRQRFDIVRDHKPLLIDRMQLAAESPLLKARPGLFGHTVYGIFACVPPEAHEILESSHSEMLINEIRESLVQNKLADKISITLINKVYVARYLGDNAEQARVGFVKIWEKIRPAMLGRKICPPRIWRT